MPPALPDRSLIGLRIQNPVVLTRFEGDATLGLGQTFVSALDREAALAQSPRVGILWTRESIYAMGVCKAVIPPGGGDFSDDTFGFFPSAGYAYEPGHYWGKRGGLVRQPRTAVVGANYGFSPAAPVQLQGLISAFAGHYSRLAKLGVHVYFIVSNDFSVFGSNPPLGPCFRTSLQILQADSPFDDQPEPARAVTFDVLPPDRFVGGKVYWARLGFNDIDFAFNSYAIPLYRFLEELAPHAPPDFPPDPNVPAGFELNYGGPFTTRTDVLPIQRAYRNDLFIWTELLTRDALALKQSKAAFDDLRFVWYNPSVSVNEGVEAPQHIPGTPDDIMLRLPTGTPAFYKQFSDVAAETAAGNLADDMMDFFGG